MARKMVETIFPAHKISSRDRNLLLTLATIAALDDLLESKVVEWKAGPPENVVLTMTDHEVRRRQAQSSRYVIKKSYRPREIETVLGLAEEIYDRYDLTEEERATLLTALPCLGLHALEEFLRWNEEPPFAELAGGLSALRLSRSSAEM